MNEKTKKETNQKFAMVNCETGELVDYAAIAAGEWDGGKLPLQSEKKSKFNSFYQINAMAGSHLLHLTLQSPVGASILVILIRFMDKINEVRIDNEILVGLTI